jgi:hypothetical protein
VHAAELAENRQTLREVRELAGGISRRLDDAIATWEGRDADVERAVLELVAVVGEAPDPSTGRLGSGMRGQIAAAINAAMRAGIRREMPSLLDEEESDITSTHDRATLIARARAAERWQSEGEIALRRETIKAWAGLACGVIGALAAAAAVLIPLLRG